MLVELYSSTDGNISDRYTHSSVRNKTYITNPINQLLTQLLHAVNIPNLPLIMPPLHLTLLIPLTSC
jgi:hypothetical protein